MPPSLVRNLRKAVLNPFGLLRMLREEPEEILRRADTSVRTTFLSLYALYQRDIRGNSGVDFMNTDWDTMLILDSCRYDLFNEIDGLDTSADRVLSSGSATHEFLKRNMDGQVFSDTVYVTANPNSHYADAEFHAVKNLWTENWDDELQTVKPDVVAEAAINAHKQFPNKRILVHFIQPHYPFIGETGQEIEQGSLTGSGLITDGLNEKTIWEQVKLGRVKEKTAWQAYRENLKIALPAVNSILDEIDGKIVVTSDHGNAFGEFGLYGHWPGLYLESMLAVPWVEIESGHRRNITEGSTEVTDGNDSVIKERLSALGYK